MWNKSVDLNIAGNVRRHLNTQTFTHITIKIFWTMQDRIDRE